MKKLLALILVLMLPFAALAEQPSPTADIHWIQKADNFIFIVDEGSAIITGYLGCDEDLVIPDELGGCPVVSIAGNAFSKQFSSGKYILLPDSLLAISMSAFYGCTSLEHVNLPSSIIHITGDPFRQRPESFSVTVAPSTYGEDWAIRNGVPFTY